MGIRGVPAAHGGFESFAECLIPFLTNAGWRVTVYCQEEGHGDIQESLWRGAQRIHIPSGADTPLNSIRFDWRSISHAKSLRPDITLILGYNTAAFALRLRLAGLRVVFNMDGIEWSRAKWGAAAKAWLYLNERLACGLGHHLIADHPAIAEHLFSRVPATRITTIPYGSEPVEHADARLLRPLNLRPGHFISLIARPEPENSILEIVQAFSAKHRNIKLVVLGNYRPRENEFHRQVMAAASGEVVFLGAIYDKALTNALRVFSRFYIHGHRVGGTNPSLLEAMGCGNAVLAHDNSFNRWVAGAGALYFEDRTSCALALDKLLENQGLVESMQACNRERVRKVFDWQLVLRAYATLLQACSLQGDLKALAGKTNFIWTQNNI
jgi:glycosyltransferase involved in cell wall biosynthesis